MGGRGFLPLPGTPIMETLYCSLPGKEMPRSVGMENKAGWEVTQVH
jgi:hypothetical protein